MKVAVIGGGPSGLTTLKHLLTAHNFHQDVEPIEARLFEAKESVAGTFRYRVWDEAELVSSKYLTTFSDFRLPLDEPVFISTVGYCQYLEDYATHFGLWAHIHLTSPVKSVKRKSSGSHIVTYIEDGVEEQWECDAIAVCTGLHVEPSMPPISGIENVPEVIHSASFKSRADFGEGKNVLILGAGETAMDISYMAVTSPTTQSVTFCHRDGFVYAPKILSIPIFLNYYSKGPQRKMAADTTIASLFDTAYAHHILQNSQLLWTAYDKWAKFYFWLISGTKHGLDQWVGGVSDERYHLSRVVICKSGRAMPFISAQYRNSSLLNRIRAAIVNIPIVPTHGRKIDIAPWPESISKEGIVTFRKTNRPESERMSKLTIKPDLIIYATGYRQEFPFLSGDYPVPLQANHRGIWKTSEPTVGFIGFVRPSFGAIPPLAELQAQLWVLSLIGKLPQQQKQVDLSYKLKFRTIRRESENYVVDHESYAYQLALDMGSAPSFTQVLSFGGKTAYTWAMGSNFNTKFRLVGPWKWDGANEVMKTELWDVVSQNGRYCFWVFTLTYTIIPFITFAILSALLFIFCEFTALIESAAVRVKNSWNNIFYGSISKDKGILLK